MASSRSGSLFTGSSSQYLGVTAGSAVITGYPATLLAWTDYDSSYGNIVSMGNSSDTFIWFSIERYQWAAFYLSRIRISGSATDGGSAPTGSAEFVASRFSSSEVECYSNGSYTGSPGSHSETWPATGNTRFAVGREPSFGGNYYTGSVSWAQAYDADMTEDQLREIQYNPYAYAGSLVWCMSCLQDGSSASDFIDWSGQGLDADAGNVPAASNINTRVYLLGGQ